jgi:quercetin dioxygenase-like cupin family protein
MFKRSAVPLWIVVAMVLSAGAALAGDDPVKVDAAHFKVVFENARVRVLEFHSNPGEKSPMHSHPGHVIYALTGGKVKHTLPDGKVSEREMKAGEAAWSDATTHAGENVGTGELRALLVEIKDAVAK